MASLDLGGLMQQVFDAEIAPRIALLGKARPNIPSAKLEAFIRTMRPEVMFASGVPSSYPWFVALLRASAYDPDPDSFAHQLDVTRKFYEGGWTWVVSSPAIIDSPMKSPEELRNHWAQWSAITAGSRAGGPWGVNVVHWETDNLNSTALSPKFQEDYQATHLRRLSSLARLSLKLAAFLGLPSGIQDPSSWTFGRPGAQFSPLPSTLGLPSGIQDPSSWTFGRPGAQFSPLPSTAKVSRIDSNISSSISVKSSLFQTAAGKIVLGVVVVGGLYMIWKKYK